MKEEIVFYIKKGRRYVPHSTYSSEFCDSFPKGTHLVQSYPGGSMRRFNVDPDYAPMIAAGRVAEEKISEALIKANELRPQTTPITPAAQKAWMKLKKELGNEAMLTRGSARDATEAAVKAMAAEAEKLLKNESIREAYEHFQLLCKLSASSDELSS